MDNRVWASGASASPPAAPASPSVGYPTPGNPLTPTPATKGGAYWFYQVGESLRNIITRVGRTPSHLNLNLLADSIQDMIEARVGDFSLDTGTANAKVVALNPAIAAYTGNFGGAFKNAVASTGAVTVDFGAGPVPLVNDAGAALVNGDLPAGFVVGYQYIHADAKAYITSLVPSQALTQAQADARYAAVDGVMGYKNQITNGCCRVAQRASVTVNGAAQLGKVDRIWLQCSGTGVSGATAQVSGKPTASGYMTGITGLTCTGGIPYASLRLRGRDTIALNSKTVTFSTLVTHNQGSTQTYTVKIYRPTTTVDVFSALTLIGSMTMSVAAVPSGGYTRISGTYTFGAGEGGNGLYFEIAPNAPANWAAANLYFGDLQLEVGSIATPFELRPYSFEKQLCQAYRCSTYSDGVLPGTATVIGTHLMIPVQVGSDRAVGNFKFPVTMRAIPTITFYSSIDGAAGNWYRSAGAANTPVAVSGNSPASTEGCGYTNSSATVTAGENIYGHIVADAEL